jgi:hypothetical protein
MYNFVIKLLGWLPFGVILAIALGFSLALWVAWFRVVAWLVH